MCWRYVVLGCCYQQQQQQQSQISRVYLSVSVGSTQRARASLRYHTTLRHGARFAGRCAAAALGVRLSPVTSHDHRV